MFKYLGVLFNYNGSFKNSIVELKTQASGFVFTVLAKCRKFDLSIDVALELFDRLVCPIILYTCEVLNTKKSYLSEKLHVWIFE